MSGPAQAPIFFGGGLPDPGLVPPLADLLEAVVREDAAALGYGGEWGFEPLREALAARLGARAGTSLGAANVVLANGSAGALERLARQLLAPGQVVAVEEVSYPGALASFRACGARLAPVRVDEHGLDVEHLESLLTGGTPAPSVLYTISTCQSPTGSVLSPERRTRLAELASRTGLTVIQDDTYGEILFDPRGTRPLIGLAPDRVIHVGSFSKTLAPGLRLGWLAAREEVSAAFAAARGDLGTTPIVQRAVGRLFATGRFDPHLAAVTSVYREKRDALLEALERELAGAADWNTPRGGFFVWLRLRDAHVSDVERFGREQGVAFLGGPYFSAGPPQTRALRLAYGELSVDRLREGVKRLARAVERASRRSC